MATHSTPFSSATSTSGQIDSPLMRQAGRELLSLALMDARNHSLHLFSECHAAPGQSTLASRLSAGVNPPLWELGYTGWFQEWWIGRNMQRALGTRCESTHARLASIDPEADGLWNPAQVSQQARLEQPPSRPDKVRAYLLETLESTLELLDKARSDDDSLYFYRLALFHEDMRGEAQVCAAQALGLQLPKTLRETLTPPPVTPREPMLIPAINWQQGSAAAPGFVFDNEKPQQQVAVPEFEIDAQPVNWAQYVEFVGDGAYDRQELWHPDGWRWLERQAGAEGEGRRGPRYVDQIGVGSGAVMQTRFGHPMRMMGQQPAMHVSWWEADAWCRWAGRRLPAEVEWEVAAHTAARRGFRWGDVWEWTASTFWPYGDDAGFKPDPYADYSQPCFGTHKALRGASFATRARMKNPKFRQFRKPDDDHMFCGFRSCAL